MTLPAKEEVYPITRSNILSQAVIIIISEKSAPGRSEPNTSGEAHSWGNASLATELLQIN